MTPSDFSIGTQFTVSDQDILWRCTDVGTRVIVAICLNKADPSWYHGPPYAVVEHVFDEYDLPSLTQIP
jgi:hypothetical protein